mgnify:CR=1 FL=1
MKNWITSSAKALSANLVSKRKRTSVSQALHNQKITTTQLAAIEGGDDGDDGDILIVDIIGG